MKIKMDFVTNSSSYNNAVIIIDNPVLLEILQKYKDMELFGKHIPFFGIGCFDSNFGYPSVNFRAITETPAFYYFEDETDNENSDIQLGYSPSRLDSVLEDIISIIEDGKENLDEGLLADLKKELNQKEDEIKHAYGKIYWRNYQHGEGHIYSVFKYDPVDGESSYNASDEENNFYYSLDWDEEKELRESLGYGETGNENDDFWEYAKRVGYIENFANFPMDEYNKYKETGEIKLCEYWRYLLGKEDVDGEDDDDNEKE